ncbi:type II secretion system protein [Candidatus Avelusimicrobium caledoniensis]|uniref:type II secretion system protein n=1 Tax=Candidatus Avelusimicrobium caledoniensis TaxID=3416220 RepID=UPI003D12004B
MQAKTGFTLLEILIVVVIASSVLAFALPAQRRAQDRNKFLAAQGVLLDIGSAVQAKRADLKMSATPTATFPDPNAVTQVTGDLDGYIQAVAFDDNSAYKNYKFYVCKQDAASGDAQCCGNNAKYIACMYNSQADDSSASDSVKLYAGARFLRNGTMEQISK